MKRIAPLALVLTFLLAVAACGSDATVATSKTTTTTGAPASSGSTEASTGSTAAGPTASGTTVEIKDSSLGKIVTNGDGITLYMFTPDTKTTSSCTGACVSAWPAAVGPATNGTGVAADDLGTITRDDGTTQATFYGHPLYTFSGDSAPGDVNGQGTGGKWYVLSPAGVAVKGSGSASTPTATAKSTDASGY